MYSKNKNSTKIINIVRQRYQLIVQEIDIQEASTQADFQAVTSLFNAYSNWCRENFVRHGMVASDDERLTSFNQEEIPGVFSQSGHAILIAYLDDKAVGCVFLRKLDHLYCEMKRLYVVPECRKMRLGLRLMEAVMKRALQLDYRFLRITSHSQYMGKAIRMYQDYGFKRIENYLEDPLQAGDTYMEYDLHNLK